MTIAYQSSRREFVRIHTDIPIRYKFLSKTVPVDPDGVFEGTSTHLSGNGLLMLGKVPSISWIPALLTEEIVLGVNMILPSVEMPVKALCSVAWVEAMAKDSDRCAMGLKFKEISKENQDEVLKYIIKAQIAK